MVKVCRRAERPPHTTLAAISDCRFIRVEYCSGMHHRGPLHSARHRCHYSRECINTNNDNRRMWLEAAHIDKDAQDLSRLIVGSRPTRPRRRNAPLLLIHTFKIITNAPTRPHPFSERAVTPLAFVC